MAVVPAKAIEKAHKNDGTLWNKIAFSTQNQVPPPKTSRPTSAGYNSA
jgi:hypothetical protein